MRQALDLPIIHQPRLVFFLRKLQLALLGLANIRDTNLLTESSEDRVLGGVDLRRRLCDLLFERSLRSLQLWKPRLSLGDIA